MMTLDENDEDECARSIHEIWAKLFKVEHI